MQQARLGFEAHAGGAVDLLSMTNSSPICRATESSNFTCWLHIPEQVMTRLHASHDASLDTDSVAQGLQWRGQWRLQLGSPVWRRSALRQRRQGRAPAARFQEALAARLSSLHTQGYDIDCWRSMGSHKHWQAADGGQQCLQELAAGTDT
jgi:hypothetical protein